MKPQHASAVVGVPAGFSGWWCERCDKEVNLSEELGSPARCPRCHKPTAVWVPEAPMQNEKLKMQNADRKTGEGHGLDYQRREKAGGDTARNWFAAMRQAAATGREGVTPEPDN